MNLEQAAGNIDIVLQNAQMKRVEHEQVLNDLKFLVARAQLADKLEKEVDNIKKERDQFDTIVKSYEADLRDELPEPERANVAVVNEKLYTPDVPEEEVTEDERTE